MPSRLSLSFFLLALASAGLSAAPTAAELLTAVDRRLFLESYVSRATMDIVEPGQESRSMSFESQSRRDKGSYIEVTAPARTKGTRFLQLEGSLWMYNPKSGSSNPIRLSSRDSFQGSTMSNADIGKTQFSDDYEAELGGEASIEHAELGAVPCRVIEAKARTPDAAYGKIVIWLRIGDDMPLRMEYFAKSGLLFKRMELSKIRAFGSITRPSVMRMESLEKKGTVTTFTLESIEARDIPATVFNKNYLTR
jgi:hypothetical protein